MIKSSTCIAPEIESPISNEKLLFSKLQKSDLTECLIYITKKHLKRCVSINGAGDGNRTRIKSLGSSHSTIELHLQPV